MILRINLIGEVQAPDRSGTLLVAGYFASIVALLFAAYVLYSSTSAAVIEKTTEVATLETQLNKLKIITKEVRDLDSKKKQLMEKIATIAALRKKKSGPVHVMDDLNLGLPERAWIVEVKEAEGGMMAIIGMALDNQTIAGYMKKLEESDYFETVDLIETRQASWKGVNIKNFTLQAKVNYVGRLLPDAVTEAVTGTPTPAAPQ